MASLSHHNVFDEAVVDIEAELKVWQSIHPDEPLHQEGLAFNRYVPTLKFGYDAYLLNYPHSLQEVLPALKTRYGQKLTASERLEWTHAEAIVKATWRRMSSAKSRQRRSAASDDTRETQSDLAW